MYNINLNPNFNQLPSGVKIPPKGPWLKNDEGSRRSTQFTHLNKKQCPDVDFNNNLNPNIKHGVKIPPQWPWLKEYEAIAKENYHLQQRKEQLIQQELIQMQQEIWQQKAERMRQSSLKENENKFVWSRSGYEFGDFYKMGEKLGSGGQGSVYTG